MSIDTQMTALADAIRVKAGTEGKLTISGMTAAVNNIVINGGTEIDLTGVTVSADKLLSGIVAVGADGEKVTGNIPTVTASSDGNTVTVPAGYIASGQSFPVVSGSGFNTSAVTVTSDGMLAGLVAIGKDGEIITGNIETVTPSLSGRTFTVGRGYVAESFSGSVPEAVVTETENKVTISTGYVSSELSYDLIIPGGGGSSAPVYRCLEVVSHPDDITVSSGVWMMKYEYGSVLKAFSLAGEYKLINPEADGVLRQWVCKATVPCTVDGQVYAGTEVHICFQYSHGSSSRTVIDSWLIFVVENGKYNLIMCQERDTDSTDISPVTVADWGFGCLHSTSAVINFDNIEFEPNKRIYLSGTAPVMVSHGGNDIVWKGEKLTFTGSGWESTGEIAAALTASGYVPVAGNSYTADTGVYATLYPDIAGEPAPVNGINVVKVTEFIPYSPAFSGVTEVIVSGIGYVGNAEEGWGEDYSEVNGKFIVTDATYYEADEKKRIYKHETQNYWLMFYDDSEYGNWGYNYWVITPYEGDSEPYSSVVCVAEDTLPIGTSEWYNMNYDTPVDVGIAATITDKKKQPLVLNAKIATGYDPVTLQWSFTEGTEHFNDYDIAPGAGEMFVANGRTLVGSTLGYDPADMENNAVIYSDPGTGSGITPQGRVLPYIHQTVVRGVPCVWFDVDTAGAEIEGVGIGTRESWAYIPLTKTINIYPEQAKTPVPPFNTVSIIGTMYCETWGNTGSGFFRLAKGINSVTSGWGGDSPVDGSIGVCFDPNYGMRIDSAWGYPSDYKTCYTAYNGKWVQFVVIMDGYTAKMYINGELRIEACNVENPGEYNYLCFRQPPDDAFSGVTVYFSKMFVFDRVVNEAEIVYQWKCLQKLING